MAWGNYRGRAELGERGLLIERFGGGDWGTARMGKDLCVGVVNLLCFPAPGDALM